MMDSLNDDQLKAAEAGSGPVMVVAGPGTGKTKTLTARIAHLLESGKAKPPEILALTFTKKAAEEMRSRVAAASGEKIRITTFHALCHELLGGDAPFVTDAQRLLIIKNLSRPEKFKGLSVRELGLIISRAKNLPEIDNPAVAKVVRAYNQALTEQGVRDFDDLLLDAYKQLNSDKEARQAAQKRYRYVLVDEFQDTNRLQYELLKLFLNHDNIFVIGDPNQSIYGFRGASGTIFTQFEQDFPNAQKITLHVNYRSAPEIVRLSNAIFPEQAPLEPAGERHGQVRAVRVLNEYSEAQWVLAEIQKAIGGGDFLRAVSDDERSSHSSLRDFAVLYRSRAAAAALQKAIDESGLPYQIVGDGSPYEKPQVQAVIALMRAVATGRSQPASFLPEKQMRQAAELLQADEHATPSAFAEHAIELLGFEPSRDLSQLTAALARFDDIKSAVRYFDDIAGNAFYDPAADAITLLTIHASKGLEFPYVFLIGVQEGLLPSKRGEQEEERRLFYVAATRAQSRLEILYAKNRGGQTAEASSLIASLSADVLPRTDDPDMQAQARRIAKRQAKRSQQSLF